MVIRKWGKEISFADLAVRKLLERNRSRWMMMRIDNVVKWRDVEAPSLEHYETGTTKEGSGAYPALMLLKALLLQSGFVSCRFLSLRTRSMTDPRLRSFRGCLWSGGHRIIRSFRDSGVG